MTWPYRTERWRALRNAVLALQPVCEACGSCKKLEVHHVNPITEHEREYRIESAAYPPPSLLRVYCKSCHSRVTGGATDRELEQAQKWAEFLEVR